MDSPPARRFLRSVRLLALALLGGCAPDAPATDPPPDLPAAGGDYRGMVLAEPLPRPDFTLTDTEGRAFAFQPETDGRLALLFIGFTNCPDICPVHMANVAAVLRELPLLADRTRVVFVTADPARDTPERLRVWLDRFDPRFVGLRGTPAEVNAIEEALALPRSVVSASADDYRVAHSALLIAFSPDGPARMVYPFGTRQADLAHDLPRLLADRWESE
jgi:protein SCO1/2